MQKFLIVLITVIASNACSSRNRKPSIQECRVQLETGDVNKICEAAYLLGEIKDTSSVVKLLTDLNDPRISNDLNFKGMSVYYCKSTALRKISGIDIKIKQHSPPDSLVIKTFLKWAIDNELVNLNFK